MKFTKMLHVILLVVTLAACSSNTATPTQAPTQLPVINTATAVPTLSGTQAPTMDATATYNAIADEIHTTETAAAPQAAATSVATTAPAATAIPLATATPLATNTLQPAAATATLIYWTATPVTQANCSIISTLVVSTGSTSDIVPNGPFDVRWEVKNTSGSTWETTTTDLRYISGTKMQTDGDIFDLSSQVTSGNQITLVVDMKAPATVGTYSAVWGLFSGNKQVCLLPFTATVK